MPSSRGSSQFRDQTFISYVSCIGRWVFHPYCHPGKGYAGVVLTLKGNRTSLDLSLSASASATCFLGLPLIGWGQPARDPQGLQDSHYLDSPPGGGPNKFQHRSSSRAAKYGCSERPLHKGPLKSAVCTEDVCVCLFVPCLYHNLVGSKDGLL